MSRRRLTASVSLVAALVGAVLTTQAGSAAAKCNNSNPVLAGTIYSLSGPAAGIGKLAQQGATLAIKDINDAGGILGRCVKQVLKDDASNPTTAAQVVRELVDQEKVAFLVGPFLSSPTAVTLPVTTAAKTIQINQSAFAASGDASKYPYVFRAETNTDQQAQIFIPFIRANKWTKIGVVVINNAFGTSFIASLNNLLPGTGISVAKTVTVNSGSADVTPQMTELKNAGVEAIITTTVADPDQTAVVRARNQLGWNVPILGFSAMHNAATTNNFSAEEMKNVFAQAYRTLTYKAGKPKPSTALAQKFVSAYSRLLKAHNLKISVSQAAGSYDAWTLVARAINGAKSLNSDAVKAYLESHPFVGVRGRQVWTATRHDGPTIDQVVYVLAKSLNVYGLAQLAPNQ